MKATDFVGKFGIKAVIRDFGHYFKDANVGTIEGLTHENEYFEVDGDELKRLVESHKLVEHMIKDHNKSFPECQIDLIGLKSLSRGAGSKLFPKKLSQAIADVEACQP